MTPTYSVNDSRLIATVGRLSKIVKNALTFSFLFQKSKVGLLEETFVLTTNRNESEKLTEITSSGKVWLVGFGPGEVISVSFSDSFLLVVKTKVSSKRPTLLF